MTPRPSMRLEKHPEPIPILYVDDDSSEAQVLAAALGEAVVNPVIHFDQATALYDYLDLHEGPFIILVDLVLFGQGPGCIGGGYEILERLRKRPDINDTRSPILAVTGTNPDPLLIERVRETGADAFIHKPISAGDLSTAIGRPGWFRVEFSR